MFDWISLCLGAVFGAICLAVGVVYLADYAVFCSPPSPFPALLRLGGISAGYWRHPQRGWRWWPVGVLSGRGGAGGGDGGGWKTAWSGGGGP